MTKFQNTYWSLLNNIKKQNKKYINKSEGHKVNTLVQDGTARVL